MLVLEPDENELLQEDSVMIQNDARIDDGILHITNRRIIYEKKAVKKLRRAEPARIYLEIPMYEILNVSSAVPKMSLLTKKKLSLEYRSMGDVKTVEFEIRRPDSMVETIKNWATTSKRQHESMLKDEDQEKFRRELEMAKAKSNRSNINMINLGTGKGAQEIRNANTGSEGTLPKPTELIDTCPECNSSIPSGSKFCPQCGYELS
ncbi:MAG: zinc ribbon domain-containing protein [Candidatus Thermoplasmatota archaeon]|jgi:hypothetical protein|nr:zinc ribbon domain-containing protein [Candidatus Thermoplasmatota archaeon]MCL5988452.1 zinc ribbon domain-containing protein [Candidatus Thermoplasmatota archaeon]